MLRVVALLVALALVQGAYVPQELIDERASRAFEDTIRKAVECIKKNLNNGIPELDLPSFNPLKLDEFNLNLSIANNPVIKGSLKVSNLVLEGGTNMNFDKLSGTIGIIPPSYSIAYNVSNPSVNLVTDYEIDAQIMGQSIYGKGSVELSTFDAYASGKMKLTVLGGIKLKQFHVEIGLKKANLKITGLMNDEELSNKISEFVTSSLPGFLEDNKEMISEEITKFVMEHFNGINNSGSGNEKLDKIINELKKLCMKLG